MTAPFNWRGGDSTSCKNTVDAVTNLQLIFERLDMDVRSAAFERAHEHLVDHPNDRHFGRHVTQVSHILVFTDAVDLLRRASLPSAL